MARPQSSKAANIQQRRACISGSTSQKVGDLLLVGIKLWPGILHKATVVAQGSVSGAMDLGNKLLVPRKLGRLSDTESPRLPAEAESLRDSALLVSKTDEVRGNCGHFWSPRATAL